MPRWRWALGKRVLDQQRRGAQGGEYEFESAGDLFFARALLSILCCECVCVCVLVCGICWQPSETHYERYNVYLNWYAKTQ